MFELNTSLITLQRGNVIDIFAFYFLCVGKLPLLYKYQAGEKSISIYDI